MLFTIRAVRVEIRVIALKKKNNNNNRILLTIMTSTGIQGSCTQNTNIYNADVTRSFVIIIVIIINVKLSTTMKYDAVQTRNDAYTAV